MLESQVVDCEVQQYALGLSRCDPLPGSPFSAQRQNRYSYVTNNRPNYVDPTGLRLTGAKVCHQSAFVREAVDDPVITLGLITIYLAHDGNWGLLDSWSYAIPATAVVGGRDLWEIPERSPARRAKDGTVTAPVSAQPTKGNLFYYLGGGKYAADISLSQSIDPLQESLALINR